VGAVSLSGSEAIVAVADVSEFRHTGKDISPLYEGVWAQELNPDCSSNAAGVLKSLGFGHLFCQALPEDPEAKKYASYADLSELLRASLRECMVIARGSKDRYGNLFENIIYFLFFTGQFYIEIIIILHANINMILLNNLHHF
jgi:hypothetical protein